MFYAVVNGLSNDGQRRSHLIGPFKSRDQASTFQKDVEHMITPHNGLRIITYEESDLWKTTSGPSDAVSPVGYKNTGELIGLLFLGNL